MMGEAAMSYGIRLQQPHRLKIKRLPLRCFIMICILMNLAIGFFVVEFIENRKNASISGMPVFVCITGQIQRLELHGKLKTVLIPLREAGFEPYIALMLTDDSEVLYTNRYKHLGKGEKFGDAFSNYTHARNFLIDHGFHVTTDHPIVQPKDPFISEGYYNKVGLTAKAFSSPELRVANHARQFHTLTRCGEEMMRGQREYKFVVRLREDVSLLDPLRVRELYQQLYSATGTKRTVIATDCRRYTGMNDRMAIVSPEASYQYFHGLFINSYTKYPHTKVRNPETYLLTTYERSGLTVIHSSFLRHVVRLETTADGSMVLKKTEERTYCPDKACLPHYVWSDHHKSQFLPPRATFACMFHRLRTILGFKTGSKWLNPMPHVY